MGSVSSAALIAAGALALATACGGAPSGDRDAVLTRVVQDPDDVPAQLRLAGGSVSGRK